MLAPGEHVVLSDGRHGSVVRGPERGVVVVRIAVEKERPGRPDRVVAGLEDVEVRESQLRPWGDEDDAAEARRLEELS